MAVRALVAAACALALLLLPSVGAAKKASAKKAASAKPTHRQAKTAPSHAKRKTRARGMRTNLPHGWVWPPSDQMKREGDRCLRDLDRLGVAWKAGPHERKIVTPVIVEDMTFGGVRLVPRWGKGPYVMDCLLARALARYAGPALANMKVVELRFGQIYKYRQVAGKKGVLSRHSLGLAMDVYAFVTADGETHVVQDEYLAGDDVLHEVEARVTDSGAFRTLLTPGNDPQHHYDHFHFEARAAGDKVVTKPTRPGEEDLEDVPLANAPTPTTRRAASDAELEGPPYP